MATGDASMEAEGLVLRELLLRCAGRDEDALARFYALTSPLAWRVASRVLPSVPQAETALVGTYTSVWRQAGTFSATRLSAWSWTVSILTEHLSPSRCRP